jgi:hypothetical protein
MSLDGAEQPRRYGWGTPRPLGGGLFPQPRPIHVALFALLVGPAIGTFVAGLADTLSPGPLFLRLRLVDVAGTIAITWPLMWAIFAVPAFIAGFAYGAWWRRAPNTAAALIGAMVISLVTVGWWEATVVPSRPEWVNWGRVGRVAAVGAVTSLICALLLEYRWRHPLAEGTPWRRRIGFWVALAAPVVFLAAFGSLRLLGWHE